MTHGVYERSCCTPENDHARRLRGGKVQESGGDVGTKGRGSQTASRILLGEYSIQAMEETYATVRAKFGREDVGILTAADETTITTGKDALASRGTPRGGRTMSTTRKRTWTW